MADEITTYVSRYAPELDPEDVSQEVNGRALPPDDQPGTHVHQTPGAKRGSRRLRTPMVFAVIVESAGRPTHIAGVTASRDRGWRRLILSWVEVRRDRTRRLASRTGNHYGPGQSRPSPRARRSDVPGVRRAESKEADA
jgi:hypothetical protein